MGRKFNRSRRFAPSTERALYKEQIGRQIDRVDLMDAIRGGEDSYLEFKVRVSNPEKLAAGICALANSGGGTIVFGVTDQMHLEGISNPDVVEQDLLAICRTHVVPPVLARIDKVSFDSGMRIVVLEVDPRRAPHRTMDGRYFIRVGATKREATGDEVAEMYRGRTGARGFEDTPVAFGHPETDIDEGALWSYVKELRGVDLSHGDFTSATVLQDMRLGLAYGDSPAPTVAGVLLFGTAAAVERLLPQSRLALRRVGGSQVEDPVVEAMDVYANLGVALDRAAAFVERYADLWGARPPRRAAGPVAARPALPRHAVREALVNALVHRDYAQLGPVQVTIFDDRLEVTNPAPDAGLTRRALELGVREPTNPRVKGIFLDPAYGAGHDAAGLPAVLREAAALHRRDRIRLAIGPDGFRVEIPSS